MMHPFPTGLAVCKILCQFLARHSVDLTSEYCNVLGNAKLHHSPSTGPNVPEQKGGGDGDNKSTCLLQVDVPPQCNPSPYVCHDVTQTVPQPPPTNKTCGEDCRVQGWKAAGAFIQKGGCWCIFEVFFGAEQGFVFGGFVVSLPGGAGGDKWGRGTVVQDKTRGFCGTWQEPTAPEIPNLGTA